MFFDCIDDVHRLCQKERRLAPPAPASQHMHAAACMPGPVELRGQGVFMAYVRKRLETKMVILLLILSLTNSLTFRRSYNHTTHTSMSCMKRRGAAAVLAMLLHPLDEYVEKMPERIMICMESVLLYLLVSPHTTKARSQCFQILSKRAMYLYNFYPPTFTRDFFSQYSYINS